MRPFIPFNRNLLNGQQSSFRSNWVNWCLLSSSTGEVPALLLLTFTFHVMDAEKTSDGTTSEKISASKGARNSGAGFKGEDYHGEVEANNAA